MLSRRTAPFAALLLAGSLAACTTPGGTGPSPVSTASQAPAASPASADSGQTPAEGPSSDSAPTPTGPAAATGPKLEIGSASLRLPQEQKWTVGMTGKRTAGGGGLTSQGIFHVSLTDFPTPVLDLDSNAKSAIQTRGTDKLRFGNIRRTQNRIVAGRESWAATASGDGKVFYGFGTVVGNEDVQIAFFAPDGFPPAKTQEWIDSILASVIWKERP